MTKRKAAKVQPKRKVARKAHYHHGELREALIAATRQLVMERGAENFTLADACRVAGVTTAAPYRHFRSKQEILEEIASRGFDELRAMAMAWSPRRERAPWRRLSPWARPMSPSRRERRRCSA